MKPFYTLLISLFSLIFVDVNAAQIPSGTWRGLLFTQDGTELPFNFKTIIESGKLKAIEVYNASEVIIVTEIKQKDDSLFFKMPYFDNDFEVLLIGNQMQGFWIKHYPNKSISMRFEAQFNVNYRMMAPEKLQKSKNKLASRYACKFESDPDLIVAEFQEKNQMVTGTFLTATGDYRYLEGCINGDQLYLSTFDGSHAYVFKSTLKGDSLINGKFFSGLSYSENWQGIKDLNAKLRNADSISFLKPNYSTLDFKFPNTQGDSISLSDQKYKGKVVIVQLMGSWCPNCLDESKFLSTYLKKNQSKGLEVIGLSYERSNDFNREKSKIDRFKTQIGIPYQVLFAGSNNKVEASKSLPMLSEIFSFPTTIVIDRKGKVRNIHTGFSGPGTGVHYAEFVEDFDRLIMQLLQEK